MTTSWKEKNKERARFWQSHIDEWSASGLSQAEYCRQKDLSRHRFTYWKRKFKPKHLPVKFVQIPEPMEINVPDLKLNIGPGLQIEIPDGFSRGTLEQVLATLKVLQ